MKVFFLFLNFILPKFGLGLRLSAPGVMGELTDVMNLGSVLRDSLRILRIGEGLCEIKQLGGSKVMVGVRDIPTGACSGLTLRLLLYL